MSDREGLQKVAHGLLLMASTGYPAKVTAANAERLATLTGRVAGPHTLAADAKLGVIVQGVQTDVAVSTGTSTAVAAELDAGLSGATVSADGEDRIKIVSDAAPTSGEASAIEIGTPASGTDASETLGFQCGQIDRRPAIVSPDPANFQYGEQRRFTDVPSWRITRAAFASTENIRRGIDEIGIVLEVVAFDQGGTSASTVEVVDRHQRIMQEILEADRSIEGIVHYLEVETIDTSPQVMRVRLENDSHLYYGTGRLTVRVRARNL